MFFFFNEPATTEIYTNWHTLSRHYALPIFAAQRVVRRMLGRVPATLRDVQPTDKCHAVVDDDDFLVMRSAYRVNAVHAEEHAALPAPAGTISRSEEHTSELQSLMRISYAVFCLKQKNKYYLIIHV